MEYLNAFLCGGVLCAVGQVLIDRTRLTPARILTGYVVATAWPRVCGRPWRSRGCWGPLPAA